MERDIIFQISVFGDFTSIKPDDATIQSMIAKLSDHGLLPSVFQEGNFTFSTDPKLQKTETTNRLQMVSIEKKINVRFAGNRIDINKASTDLTIGVTNDDLAVLLDILSKATVGLSFTRIGFNTTSLLDSPSAQLHQKIQPGIDFFNNSDELTLRVNKRKNISFEVSPNDASNETSNVILTIQKTMGQLLINNQQISIGNGFIMQFDINTTPEKSEPRLFSVHTKAYIEAAEELRQSLLKELIS